ncbi:homoserine kinase [Fructobacillus evanidus]|uniref:Homoserine kinase n=1 Tax=Fructobacillus evanidus TaxID=3064281 RepID=A0ABM9MZH6_9LACO|nr:Homoserine kinase (ThrB) [Fructobacillus sp. LMG 32999]CAK1246714.1 Homoserine kinase (ThrB) [Fructobacillus sp. LMG 32999]CAK1250856.1 Homoserine kinase (ThrB) [Fructobacillus sp. LMG 32999]CAK1253479.1 Homoserine kinase (ThrB) [Fructobacillus sp. LMG 32999]CAK1253500.1 Homoserine kinase (ThrB) [Fructobacillus sp. LMG 32999]
MLTITVPASSANLGLGFDCLGLALNLNLTVTVGPKTDTWQVDHPFGADIPNDETNLIVQTARLVDPDITPHQLIVKSDIPLARGLGSSSSALVAGLFLGHYLVDQTIDRHQVLQEAAALEGHPDNVAPTILGGLQLTDDNQNGVQATTLPLPKNLVAVTFIPDYPLKTAEARAALPANLPLKTAVHQSQHLANLVAACYLGDQKRLMDLVEEDQMHEPYRADLAPEFLQIRALAHSLDLAGTYLSGAGPTVVSIVERGHADQLLEAINGLKLNGTATILAVQHTGATLTGSLD